MKKKLKICLIGTYPPTKCGIAEFTKDLYLNLIGDSNVNVDVKVVSIIKDKKDLQFISPIIETIRKDVYEDYITIAETINKLPFDVICLQHEFGLFGGEGGNFILALLKRIKKPIITTLHTVTSEYCPEVLDEIIHISEKIVIMNNMAINIIKDEFNCQYINKIQLIRHGIPEINQIPSIVSKAELGFSDKLVLLTFGLLHSNKGIEVIIQSLQKIIDKHPNVILIVLGETHPEVLANEGEKYRNLLIDTVEKLKLNKNVIFCNKFLDKEELFLYLSACDIYVSAYKIKEQIVSGTLSYAAAASCAIVSTPYLFAKEFLSDNCGLLFDFDNVEELSEILLKLISDENLRNKLSKIAYLKSQTILWSKAGEKYINLFKSCIRASVS